MGKIVISENVSLDGVIQDPTGGSGFRHGGWFERAVGEDRDEWAEVEYAEAVDAAALLLGRGTYTYFATRWVARTGAWAERLSNLPKYVVSSTLHDPEWSNTTVLPGEEVVDAVSKLKHDVDGEIVVYASGRLVRTLMECGLADEIRLLVFPVILGSGERIFGQADEEMPLRRIRTRDVGKGIASLTYEIVRSV